MRQELLEGPPEHDRTAQAPFLTDLFGRVNAAGVRYCVLGGAARLPFSLGGGDLDILVSPDCIARAGQIARETARDHGGRCVSRYHVFCISFCGRDEAWWGAFVDLFAACAYRAVSFLDTETILRRAVISSGVRMAASEDAALYRLMKEVIYNGKPRRDYEEKARLAYAVGCREMRAHLHKVLGAGVAELWCSALSGMKQPVNWPKLSRSTRRRLLFRALRHRGSHVLIARLRNTVRRLGRIVSPPGAMIAILGTDGSGKSTLLQAITPILRDAVNHEPRCEHMRPNLLPSLGRLFGRPAPKGPVTDPHGSRPSGFAGSLLRLAYYTADYVLGYWLKVYPAMVKRPTIWILDRYFYDYYIDPTRGRIRLPKWIIRLFSVLVPKPDVILCLGTDPEVIHRRKPELPVEEVRRQVEELRTFCDGNPRAVWIDVSRPVEECVDRALDAITERMARRYGWPDGA